MSAPASPTAPDRSVLWGVLGILLCWFFLPGFILSIFSIRQARENGRSPVLGIVGVTLTVIFQIFLLIKYVG